MSSAFFFFPFLTVSYALPWWITLTRCARARGWTRIVRRMKRTGGKILRGGTEDAERWLDVFKCGTAQVWYTVEKKKWCGKNTRTLLNVRRRVRDRRQRALDQGKCYLALHCDERGIKFWSLAEWLFGWALWLIIDLWERCDLFLPLTSSCCQDKSSTAIFGLMNTLISLFFTFNFKSGVIWDYYRWGRDMLCFS